MTDTATHLLGHGSCLACQDDGRRLIKELRHLRAINAKLLEALEGIIEARDAYHGGDLMRMIDKARPVVEEARK